MRRLPQLAMDNRQTVAACSARARVGSAKGHLLIELESRWQIAAAALIVAKTQDGRQTIGKDGQCGAVMRASLFDPALTQHKISQMELCPVIVLAVRQGVQPE